MFEFVFHCLDFLLGVLCGYIAGRFFGAVFLKKS